MSGTTSATGGWLAPAASPAVLEDPGLTDLLQEMVVGITALPPLMVRPRWQPTPPNQPPATTDWCALGITMRRDEGGTPYVGHDAAGAGTDTLSRHQTLDVLVTFYGPNAAALADRLYDGLWIAQNRETLILADCGLVNVGDVLTTSEPINGQFVAMAELPFSIRRQRRRTFPVLNMADPAPINMETDGP